MPCSDNWPSEPQAERRYHGLTAEQLEALLCAILTYDESVLGVIMPEQWAESGITLNQAKAFWKDHQADDKLRREREARQRDEAVRQAMLKASALKKLTPAERTALGL